MSCVEYQVRPNEKFVRVPCFRHFSDVLTVEQHRGQCVHDQINELNDQQGDQKPDIYRFEDVYLLRSEDCRRKNGLCRVNHLQKRKYKRTKVK